LKADLRFHRGSVSRPLRPALDDGNLLDAQPPPCHSADTQGHASPAPLSAEPVRCEPYAHRTLETGVSGTRLFLLAEEFPHDRIDGYGTESAAVKGAVRIVSHDEHRAHRYLHPRDIFG